MAASSESTATTATAPSTTERTEADEPYRGGEKSIEEFGEEASGTSRGALLAAFHGYLGALADEDMATACLYLDSRVQATLRQLAPKGLKGAPCARLLPRVLVSTAAGYAHSLDRGRITKVRVEGDRAFVIFHAPGAKLYQMTMAREGGRWKTTSVAPPVLVPSPASLGF